MSNKTISIDTSEDETQNVEDIKQGERQNISKDDHSTHTKNESLVSEDPDNKSDNNTIQNASDDTLHTDGAEKIHKKYINKSKTDIANLKSEFTGVIVQDTKHKKIDMIGNSGKYRKSKIKGPKVYSEDTVIVQFLGSENLPAKKVEMIYDPESRNYTVKMMFAMLLMMHFIVGGGTLYLSKTTDIQHWWWWYAPYVALLGFIVTIILVLCMICLGDTRVGFRSSVVIFGTLISSIAFNSAFSYILNWRIFVFVNATLVFMDIVCIVVGCTSFDYTSMLMYAIVVGGGVLLGIGVIPGLNFLLLITGYQLDDWRFNPDEITELVVTALYLLISLAALVAELHIMLDGETIQLAEDDYTFGAYLLFISIVDFPIRFMRKRGYLGEKAEREEEGGGGEEEGGWWCSLM